MLSCICRQCAEDEAEFILWHSMYEQCEDCGEYGHYEEDFCGASVCYSCLYNNMKWKP